MNREGVHTEAVCVGREDLMKEQVVSEPGRMGSVLPGQEEDKAF